MNIIVEFILSNYTWILIGSIIILLAVIGWYADKTNFGQGKTNDKELVDFREKRINEVVDKMKDKRLLDEINEEQLTETSKVLVTNNNTNNQNKDIADVDIQPIHPIQNINSEKNFNSVNEQILNDNISDNKSLLGVNEKENNNQSVKNSDMNNITLSDKTDLNVQKKKKSKDTFEDFEKKFNEVVSEKKIIEEDIFEDIENLELDKTQKISLNDISDLDDIDLPRIKPLKSDD